MDNPLIHTRDETPNPIKTSHILLRLLRARQPISRIELANYVGFHRSTVTSMFKPLITAGIVREGTQDTYDSGSAQGRPRVGLRLEDGDHYFIGLNLGVRHSQIGAATLNGEILAEEEFATPPNATEALKLARKKIKQITKSTPGRTLRTIGVSVPGLTDPARRDLLYAPHLGWTNVPIAEKLESGTTSGPTAPVIVENDATAAAMFEAQLKLRTASDGTSGDFIIIRSGTGIGVGLVLGGEVYRGSGLGRGVAGEFGHMTIVADGKLCVCGNRGCWEQYASAPSAASVYTGERAQHDGSRLRFKEIVARAEAGERRAQRSLERLGEYLGIGIANVILGVGIAHVIISGRLVYGWQFIEPALRQRIERSIAGRLPSWTVERGEPKGSAFGGAIEVAVEEYLANLVI